MTLFGVEISQAVLASLIAACVAMAGTLTVVSRDAWARRNRVFFTSFAAGILLTMGLLLIPSAMDATANAPRFVLAGYLVLYTINVVFSRRSGAVVGPLLAIGIHSFVDGFEYGVLFEYDTHTGWIAALGLIAHEFAEGVILYTFMRSARLPVFISVLGAFVGAALTTPLGALSSQYAIEVLSADVIGMLLAGAAGALIYLGATHLPSHDAPRARRPKAVLCYMLGIVLALGLSMSHRHDEDNHHSVHHEDHADDHDDEPATGSSVID